MASLMTIRLIMYHGGMGKNRAIREIRLDSNRYFVASDDDDSYSIYNMCGRTRVMVARKTGRHALETIMKILDLLKQ